MSRKWYRDIIRVIRIIEDYWRRKSYRIYRQNISSTSTSNSIEWLGSHAKEYGPRFRMVWWRQNKIWRLIKENLIISQKQ